MTLKCSFLAYPADATLDIVWLADYNHLQRYNHNHHHHHTRTGTGTQSHNQRPRERRLEGLAAGESALEQLRGRPEEADRAEEPAANRSRLPAEERFIVLYDSKLHRRSASSTSSSSGPTISPAPDSNTNEQNDIFVDEQSLGADDSLQRDRPFDEIQLHGSRILIRETRPPSDWPSATTNGLDGAAAESIVKESQIIIQSAHVDDSAR